MMAKVGECLACGDWWTENEGESIEVCPECASTDVVEVGNHE